MLIINKMYPPEIGGIEVITKQIVDLCITNEIETEVLTFNNINKLLKQENGKLTVYRLNNILKFKSIRFSFKYKQFLSKLCENNKIVLYHYPSFQPEFYKYKKDDNVKVVYYHADNTKFRFVSKLYQRLIADRFLRNADYILVSNPNIIKSSKTLTKYKEKCKLITYGIDTNHFYYRENNQRKNILERINGCEQSKVLLFVGRMARYKGFNYLLEALKRLPKEYKLIVVSNDNINKHEEKYIDINNLESRIIHYKGVSYNNLPFYYSSADVLVMPSTDRAEAFGLVAVEAMACGTPVITTELGTGTSYHNICGVTGLVVKPKDDISLEKAILEVCTKIKYKDKEKIVKRAKEFTYDNFKDNFMKFIKYI